MNKLGVFLLFLGVLLSGNPSAQSPDPDYVKSLVEEFKEDPRGPYRDIRWFCEDGSLREPKDPCPEPGGVQRARYKSEVEALAEKHHLFLGQILSTTPHPDFWDAANYHSRLKQYQLEQYLRAIDDGWVLRKAQFYRGAIQAEDEENWGVDFFNLLLNRDEVLEKNFFLVRQAVRDIPHQGDNAQTRQVRALSKVISDKYTPFQDLRVKIHGQPDAGDIRRVRLFLDEHRTRLSPDLQQQFDQLTAGMEELYQPVTSATLRTYLKRINSQNELGRALAQFLDEHADDPPNPARLTAAAELLWKIREEILLEKSRRGRLALLDLSIALEDMLFKELGAWKTTTLDELLEKTCYQGLAAAGCGFVEPWEWSWLIPGINPLLSEELTLTELNQALTAGRSLVEWGAAMPHAVYEDVVEKFGSFEPLAYGFYDDRVRSSVLLSLGESVSLLGDFLAEEAAMSNRVMNIPNQSHMRGLNPGLAMGELVVVGGNMDEVEVSKDKIYVFDRPPSDLKPVAGIATVSEGNMVSHVQLLARNLAIPNAVISGRNLEDLKRFSGQQVFYAVSNRGTVIMKPADQMTAEEKQLFAVKQRSEEKVRVPVDKIVLEQSDILDLRSVKADDSGKLCGPKAANLGQLKLLFPEHVVEGLVIPFGIFRQHLDQTMPDSDQTYWAFLNSIFAEAQALRSGGRTEEEVDAFVLGRLEQLRQAIKTIPLLPGFREQLEVQFQQVLGSKLGDLPVFLRSDTNMEDLKDFTGAGLNLTLFNVVNAEKILQGIKDVWASPYTERSYKWRQRYLLNPENVYPSILIIPSVDVEYSGVLITKGIVSGDPRDLTIAFSRGAGGAVDGQAAESYLLSPDGRGALLSPAREPTYRRLPDSGGTSTHYATFEKPILSAANLWDVLQLSERVREVMPEVPGIASEGPFDVELGFREDKIWLFQIRPFVENKNAAASLYLQSITPLLPENKRIQRDAALQVEM